MTKKNKICPAADNSGVLGTSTVATDGRSNGVETTADTLESKDASAKVKVSFVDDSGSRLRGAGADGGSNGMVIPPAITEEASSVGKEGKIVIERNSSKDRHSSYSVSGSCQLERVGHSNSDLPSPLLPDHAGSDCKRSSKSLIVEERRSRLRASIRENIATQERSQQLSQSYSVESFYKKNSLWTRIATSQIFENATLAVISLNAIWMWIETDFNKAPSLRQSEPGFILGENLFCAYFTLEIGIRFMAFQHKFDGLRDSWFIFDSLLVTMMIVETWIIFAVIGDGPSPLDGAGVIRLVRLLRLSRLVRMLRSAPQLMILIKGMISAMKTVSYVFCMLLLCTYVFAIACVQLTEGIESLEDYFKTVPLAMYSLAIYGTFLDNLADFMDDIRRESPLCLFTVSVYICLSSLTVMNMLIGVLCEVISEKSSKESEELKIEKVSNKMESLIQKMDSDGNKTVSYDEFMKMLEESAEAVQTLKDVDVDPEGLVDFADVFFMEDGVSIELEFPKFMEMVLDMRSTNTATLKDVMHLRKKTEMKMVELQSENDLLLDRTRELEKEVKTSSARIESQLGNVLNELRSLAERRSSPIN